MKKLILICLISVGLVSLSVFTAGAKKGGEGSRQVKYEICHQQETDGDYVIISVAEPAVAAHERHGDFLLPESGICSAAEECFDLDTAPEDDYLARCEQFCGLDSFACFVADFQCSGDGEGSVCAYLPQLPCICGD